MEAPCSKVHLGRRYAVSSLPLPELSTEGCAGFTTTMGVSVWSICWKLSLGLWVVNLLKMMIMLVGLLG